jgi:hypothetical protein
MRKDMSKVIVERPRTGRSAAGKRPGRTAALTDDDGEPIRAVKSTREPRGREQKTKSLNETLNPLKRYLASNVGRPWDKVYSEIAEHLKPTSTVQQHVRDHIEDFVAISTRMKAGAVMMTPRHGGERAVAESHVLYYVHPRTGILRHNENRTNWSQRFRKAKEKAAAELAARMRVIDAKTQLHLFDGAWWEVKLAKIKRHPHKAASGMTYYSEEPYVDVVRSAKLSRLPLEKLYGRDDVYACDKRQLSKADLKRLKLR